MVTASMIAQFNTLKQKINTYRNTIFFFDLIQYIVLILLAFSFGSALFSISAKYIKNIVAIRALFSIELIMYSIFCIFFFPKRRSLIEISKKIEQEHNVPLVSAVEIEKYLKENKYGYSLECITDHLNKTAEIYKDIVFNVNWRKNTKKIVFQCAGIFILSMISLYNSVSIKTLKDIKYEFSIKPGNAFIKKGDSVDITINFKTIAPKQYWIKYAFSNSSEPFKSAEFKEKFTFEKIYSNIEYYIYIDKTNISDKFTLFVEQPPELKNISAGITYPEYTKLSPVVQRNSGNIEALLNTNIELSVEMSKPVKYCSMKTKKNDQIYELNNVSFNEWKTEFTVLRSFDYFIEFQDNEGIFYSHPVEFYVKCLRDNSPEVQIVTPAKNIVAGLEDKIPITFSAADDFYISKTVFSYSTDLVTYHEIDLKQTGKKVLATFFIDLKEFDLSPNMRLAYKINVFDNYPDHPQQNSSAQFFILFNSSAQSFKKAEKEYESIVENIDKVAQQQKNIQKKFEETLKTMKAEENLSWKDKKEIENIKKTQEKTAENIEQIKKDLEKTIKEYQDSNVISKDVINTLKNIKDLVDELLSSEIKDMLQKMNRIADSVQLTVDDKKRFLKEFSQKQYAEKLERMLSMLKKIKNEQQFSIVEKILKDIIKHQRTAAEMNTLNSSEKTNVQTGIQEEFREFNEQFQKLLSLMKGSPYENMLQEWNELHLIKNNISQNIEIILKQLNNSEDLNALKKQNEIIRTLQNAQEEFSKIKDTFINDSKKNIISKLEKLLQNILSLSKFQKNIILNSQQKINGEIIGKQHSMLKYCRSALDLCITLMGESFLINKNSIVSIFSMYQNIEKITELFAENNTNILPLQRSALKNCNESAYYIVQSLEQIEKASSAMGFEEMMKKMQDLAEKQKGLNKSGQSLMQDLSENGIPNGLQEEFLKQMAFEQQLLAGQLSEMSENMSGQHDLSDKMNSIAKQMFDIEKQLKKGNINRKIIDEQKKILERMLDIQRSLSSKEKEEKDRKAFAAEKDFWDDIPKTLLHDNEPIEREWIKTIEQNISDNNKYIPEYRELIKEYFRVLSTYGN